jgi:uncharacterized protein (TIGR02001 family)
MKKSVIIITALLAGVGLRADVPAEPTVTNTPRLDYSVTSSIDFSSAYVFRGIKQTNQAIQPSVEVDSNNFDLGVWTSQPIRNNEQDEFDFYGGYKYAVNKDLTLEPVLTYYWYPEFSRHSAANIDGTADSFEPGLGATYTINGFSPSLFYYYDTILERQTTQGSLGYALPLAKLGTELDLTGYIGTVHGDNLLSGLHHGVHKSYNFYGADVSLPYKLASNCTVTAAVHYGSSDHEPMAVPENLVWWSLALTMGF